MTIFVDLTYAPIAILVKTTYARMTIFNSWLRMFSKTSANSTVWWTGALFQVSSTTATPSLDIRKGSKGDFTEINLYIISFFFLFTYFSTKYYWNIDIVDYILFFMFHWFQYHWSYLFVSPFWGRNDWILWDPCKIRTFLF